MKTFIRIIGGLVIVEDTTVTNGLLLPYLTDCDDSFFIDRLIMSSGY